MDALGYQKLLTRAFVAQRPLTVRLQGVTVTDGPDGGRKTVQTPLRRPVTVTLVEPPSSGYSEPLTTTQGSTRPLDYMLVAEVGVDVREGDEFEPGDGHRYHVATLLPGNGYEVRAYLWRAW